MKKLLSGIRSTPALPRLTKAPPPTQARTARYLKRGQNAPRSAAAQPHCLRPIWNRRRYLKFALVKSHRIRFARPESRWTSSSTRAIFLHHRHRHKVRPYCMGASTGEEIHQQPIRLGAIKLHGQCADQQIAGFQGFNQPSVVGLSSANQVGVIAVAAAPGWATRQLFAYFGQSRAINRPRANCPRRASR